MGLVERLLSIEDAIRTPQYGAPIVVLGAPLAIDANSFKAASGNLEDKLRLICERVHAYGDIPIRARTAQSG
jgi:3-hexulose-6-phosphate synthase